MKVEGQITNGRRVVIIHWKRETDHPFQVFSNLKNFCASYPRFNYNTLNNYLSKGKKAYENDQVRIERKNIITDVLSGNIQPPPSRIVPVVKKGRLKEIDQDSEDLKYWYSRPVGERAGAVTSIVEQSLKPDQRMDKSFVKKSIVAKK